MTCLLAPPRRFAVAVLLAAFLVAASSPPANAQTTKDEPKPKAQENAKAKAKAKAKPAPTRPPLPPTHENVPYGDHPRQVLDFYQAETKAPPRSSFSSTAAAGRTAISTEPARPS